MGLLHCITSFNVSKFKVMHIGSSDYTYRISDTDLEVASEEMHLGWLLSSPWYPLYPMFSSSHDRW